MKKHLHPEAKILLVDDEPTHVHLLTQSLEIGGYVAIASTTESRDAVRLQAELQPDLVILDWWMPGAGGLRVLEQLRALSALPILVVTADASIEARREALALGASDFVIKPYDLSEILARVGNLLETHFLHRELARQNLELVAEAKERQAAVEALRLERDELRDFFESAPTGLHWVGADGTILWANRAELDLGGYTREEYIGHLIGDFYVDVKIPGDFLRRLLSHEPLLNYESRVRCKNGAIRHVLINSNVMRRGGEFIHTRCFVRDITERKRAEEALQQSEGLLQAILDHSPALIFIKDLESRFILINRRYEQLFGVNEKETIGQTAANIFPQEVLAPLHRHDRAVIDSGAAMEFEEDVLLHGGERRIYMSIKFPLRNAAGEIFAVCGIASDITERKRTESALRASDARYQRIAANLPGMVYQYRRRRDGWISIPYASEGCRELFGLDPAVVQADAEAIHQLILPEEMEGFLKSVRESVETMEPWKWEGCFRLASGEVKCIQGASRPELQPNGDILWDGLLMDVTARRMTEEIALQAKDEAERANIAKSEFLSRMSHELRTPLNAILGFAQLLENEGRDPEDAESVGQILKAGRHLLDLINEILDISGIEAGRMELVLRPTLLSEVLEETLSLVRPLATEREVKLGSLVCDRRVLIDRQRFKQVLLNLFSNAIKYNRHGGSVALTAADTASGTLRLSISDMGSGLSPKDAAKVFTAFERLGAAQTKVEGIGLGLAISKRLIELMGGRIGVESVVGEGSTFWLEVPLAEASQAVPAEPSLPEVASAGPAGEAPSKTLLYIDDNLSNLQLIGRILARRPAFKLLTSFKGRHGLEMAVVHRPDYILLDLHLPDMRGDEVLAQLLADPRTAGIPVVMISADATPQQIERLRAAGARDYLTKPVDVRKLLGLLDELVASRV